MTTLATDGVWIFGRELNTYALNRYMSARTGNNLRSNRLQSASSAAGSIIRAVCSVDPSSAKETDSERFSVSEGLESISAIVSVIRYPQISAGDE